MPDGGAAIDRLVYKRAVRGRFAPLIMISGPSGTGKTYSALRLAKGMAGPDGKVFLADTDNSRGRLYADEFDFLHLDLREPFRPMLFEQAAMAAQKQGASVLIIDNFGHEWAGPGGILSWHEEELERMAGDNFARREQLKMVVWGKVKPPHKHMLQRLYQINMAIILCCFAEKKIAMVKQTEGKDKGKVIPVDQGFQPVGDKDAAFAMTASLLLPDVEKPGVPVPIKALLPALKPIIRLDQPLDEATGAAIAAWARGEKPATSALPRSKPASGSQAAGEREKPEADRQKDLSSGDQGNATKSQSESGLTEGQTGADPRVDSTPPDGVPPPSTDEAASGPPPPESTEPPTETKRAETDERAMAKAQELAEKFAATQTRADHNAIVDNADNQKAIAWLKKARRQLFVQHLEPFIKASWTRTDPQRPQQDLGLGEKQ